MAHAHQRPEARNLLTSAHLVPLWEEAFARSAAEEPGTQGAARWEAALQRLVEAMDGAERIAANESPPLGRRRWATRAP